MKITFRKKKRKDTDWVFLAEYSEVTGYRF
jgi:hypothetical protein